MFNLDKGEKIGIIALSGAVNKNKLQNAIKYFEQSGCKVELSKNIYDKNRYLASNDSEKISELYRFFKDENIKLIINARGGYGTIRLINKIDYSIIKNNPKPFCGYSDITALLLMIYKKTGITTYHSPMASGDFGCTDINKYTEQNFLDVLNNKTQTYTGTKLYKNGKAKGIIWGGNLSTVVSLCGLNFIPNRNFIFFAEDLNEPVYKIDKMFQQLINIKKFTRYCKGIVLGDFLSIDNEKWFDEYFYELAPELNIPIVGGFKITHEKEKITIPIGHKCTLQDYKLVIE